MVTCEEFVQQLKEHGYVSHQNVMGDTALQLRRNLVNSPYFFDIRCGRGWGLSLRINPFGSDTSLDIMEIYSIEKGFDIDKLKEAELKLYNFAKEEWLPRTIKNLQLPELTDKVEK